MNQEKKLRMEKALRKNLLKRKQQKENRKRLPEELDKKVKLPLNKSTT